MKEKEYVSRIQRYDMIMAKGGLNLARESGRWKLRVGGVDDLLIAFDAWARPWYVGTQVRSQEEYST